MRGTFEYSQDTIPGPTEDQTQEQFEESFIESDECYRAKNIKKSKNQVNCQSIIAASKNLFHHNIFNFNCN